VLTTSSSAPCCSSHTTASSWPCTHGRRVRETKGAASTEGRAEARGADLSGGVVQGARVVQLGVRAGNVGAGGEGARHQRHVVRLGAFEEVALRVAQVLCALHNARLFWQQAASVAFIQLADWAVARWTVEPFRDDGQPARAADLPLGRQPARVCGGAAAGFLGRFDPAPHAQLRPVRVRVARVCVLDEARRSGRRRGFSGRTARPVGGPVRALALFAAVECRAAPRAPQQPPRAARRVARRRLAAPRARLAPRFRPAPQPLHGRRGGAPRGQAFAARCADHRQHAAERAQGPQPRTRCHPSRTGRATCAALRSSRRRELQNDTGPSSRTPHF